MSEQWTAPHMLRQQARAMRSFAGRSSCVKWSQSASMTRLHDARGVGGRRVAVHPALGVDDVADGVVGAADREPVRRQFLLQGLDLGFVLEQELDIVAAGEAQVAAAVLVRQGGEKAQRLNAGQPRRGGANRVQAVAGLRHMAENAGRHGSRGISTCRSSS